MTLHTLDLEGLWAATIVALAGGVGAVLRYLIDTAIPRRARYPWGTTLVNLTGSFALGVVVGATAHWLPPIWALALGTGLLGGYTTFSTASIDTLRLLRGKRYTAAVLNLVGTLLCGVALALLGYALTS